MGDHWVKGTPRLLSAVAIVLLLLYNPGVMAQPPVEPACSAKPLHTITSDFNNPSDVVAGKNGQVYVLDGVNNKVKVFNQKGAFLFSFGKTGTGKGALSFPLGIGIDRNDRIFIADSGNHRVQIFSPEGNYLSHFSTETTEKQIKPSDPTDLVVDSTGKKCYTIDNDNHWIFVYDLQKGQPVTTYGTMGMEKGEFRFPFLLDRDQEDRLYVVEVINTRVTVLDPDGKHRRTIGSWGVEKGEFYRPKGVAVDLQKRVFVSDSYLGVIQVFDQDGTFICALRDDKGAITKFVTPTGIFIDGKMKLYVVEMLANRVSVLQLQQ
jgi:tripartite motif-containing protein 71